MYQPTVNPKEKSPNQTVNTASDQDPQGILKQDNTLDQDSPGILQKIPGPLVSKKKYKKVRIENIRPYEGIFEYIEPKPSTIPTVVKTPTQYFCIDGQYLIKKALKQNKIYISCHVIYIDTESEFEIALRKATIRCVSDEGKPIFSELVRNCKQLLQIFLDSTENPIFYSHGGKRKDIQYDTANRENNIRMLLAERFNNSVSTTNKYINYGSYLNDEILDILVQSKVGKKFFEAAASNKRRLIKNYQSEGKDDDYITEKVSEHMTGWLQEWFENNRKKISPLPYEADMVSIKTRCLIDLPKIFNHHGEVESSYEELSEKTLRQDLQNVGLEIYTNLNDEKFGTPISVETFKESVKQALTLVNKLTLIKEVA